RLAGTRWTDNSYHLAGPGAERHVAQDRLARFVLGPHAVEHHVTLDRRHLFGVRCVLQVRHQVDKAKDALAAGNRALNVGPHGGDLRNRLVEALREGDERHDQAERDGATHHALAAEQDRATPPATRATAT